MSKKENKQTSELQLVIPAVKALAEVDGIEMGVLDDGTAYLSARGLARLCDVAPSAVIDQGSLWLAGGRTNKLAQVIQTAGFSGESLYIPTKTHEGRTVHAHPDTVCMAFLYYYGFVASPSSPEAARRYHRLALESLRTVIYKAVGYDASAGVPAWQHIHDRLKLQDLPYGYFSVFRESADIAIAASKGGLHIDHHTVPDISIGKAWGMHWKEIGLEAKYGERIHHPHNYPLYYPQAESNPQEIWVYPLLAAGEFKVWLQGVYIPHKFPAYLGGMAKKGAIAPAKAKALLSQLLPDDKQVA
jgi:hypothetical protein